MRDTIGGLFTPSRVGVLSWAFVAVVMGTVGLASYKFGAPILKSSTMISGLANIPLPSAGDVSTTASINPNQRGTGIEVISMPDSSNSSSSGSLEQSQIKVLQEQIVRLRRRLSALSEQNAAYSRRIGALEKVNSVSNTNSNLGNLADNPAKPSLGVASIDTATLPSLRKVIAPQPKPRLFASPASNTENEIDKPNSGSLARIPEVGVKTMGDGRSRRINIHTGQQSQQTIPTMSAPEPVRIVELPRSTEDPASTSSINPEARGRGSNEFDSAPTTNVGKRKIITPSEAVGRLHGSGQNTLRRSDFGAVVGNYQSLAEAANAWANFKDQNEERMSNLRPLIMDQNSAEGGVSLLVGPFGNAADAAVACLHLLEVTEYCHPALYDGDPLVAASDFRETAFQ
ncbi:MAG: hypothetical protein ABJY83_05960 [Roseibium sp.]